MIDTSEIFLEVARVTQIEFPSYETLNAFNEERESEGGDVTP